MVDRKELNPEQHGHFFVQAEVVYNCILDFAEDGNKLDHQLHEMRITNPKGFYEFYRLLQELTKY